MDQTNLAQHHPLLSITRMWARWAWRFSLTLLVVAATITWGIIKEMGRQR